MIISLLVSVETGRSGYRGERLVNVMHDVLDRLKNIPGVRSASLAAPTPLMGAGASGWITTDGFQEASEEKRRISISWVSPGYFEAYRDFVLAGRDFASGDEAAGKVAIISEGYVAILLRRTESDQPTASSSTK